MPPTNQNPQSPFLPMFANIPTSIRNMDAADIADRLGRFVTELYRSVSADVSVMTTADVKRLNDYLTRIVALVTQVQAAPEMDFPATKDFRFPVEPLDANIPDTNNEDVKALLRHLAVTWAEVVSSASGAQPSRLMNADEARLRAAIQKASDYLNKFVVPGPEMDMPASTLDSATPGAKPPIMTGP